MQCLQSWNAVILNDCSKKHFKWFFSLLFQLSLAFSCIQCHFSCMCVENTRCLTNSDAAFGLQNSLALFVAPMECRNRLYDTPGTMKRKKTNVRANWICIHHIRQWWFSIRICTIFSHPIRVESRALVKKYKIVDLASMVGPRNVFYRLKYCRIEWCAIFERNVIFSRVHVTEIKTRRERETVKERKKCWNKMVILMLVLMLLLCKYATRTKLKFNLFCRCRHRCCRCLHYIRTPKFNGIGFRHIHSPQTL